MLAFQELGELALEFVCILTTIVLNRAKPMINLLTMLVGALIGIEAQLAHIPVAEATTTPEIIVERTIEEKIRIKAIEHGLDPDFMARIAFCESEFLNIPNYLYDGENGRYTAYGPFQILKSTALDYSTEDRKIVDNNIEIAMLLFKDRGSQPWNESIGCWSK